MERLVVVGGGISGLATACHAREEAQRLGLDLAVTVLEAAGRPGGRMWSDREEGFVVEHGPNGFLDNKPDALDLAMRLGAGDGLLRASPLARKRFICRGGRLRRLPESPPAFLASRLLSWRGKARILREPFAPPPPDRDETLAEFARRRLGPEALDFLIDPMVSGVFAGNPERLSLRASFPRIAELEREYGGLFKALWRLGREGKRRKGSGPAGPGGTLTSFRGGVRTLVETLAAALGESLVLDAPVRRIERTASGYRVLAGTPEREYAASAVVLACPAYEAARLCGDWAPGLAGELDAIPYAPVTVVATAYARADVPHPLDGFGFLVPGREERPVLGTLWDSSVFPDRAPAARVLLRTMIGGARHPDLAAMPERDAVAAVRAQLKDFLGVRADPLRVWVYHHERGIPQYEVGHLDRMARIEAALGKTPGLFLCHNAYRGIALNDCAREARVTAEAVLRFLGADDAVGRRKEAAP